MERKQVTFKRIVSPDGKTIVDLRSIAKTSGDGQNEIHQSWSVEDNQSQASQNISVNISSSGHSAKSSQATSISIKKHQ
jgi:hypothetical protein